jgi:D-alanyl-lipoteichoic acid acyltransferase DltB (MBOAT superfamily)
MLFNSYAFILMFLPAVLAGAFLLQHANRLWLELLLILASLFFYAWWDVRYVPLLLGSVAVNYLGALFIERTHSRLALAAIIAFNLILLGYYKYLGFFSRIASKALPWEPWDVTLLALILPLGISFFTFHQIGYQIDRFRGQAGKHNFIDYTLFVTFFPQLIAGPIVRQYEFLPQLHNFAKRIGVHSLLIGLTIFSIGLFKKVIFADTFALYATPVFDTAAKGVTLDGQTAWLGVLAFTFQIFFDFSGYSDMAIGLARMVGINLPINFNAPYRSTSITEFWRRWHITLGRFLRDYLYFPLGGSRVAPLHQFANLMVVMLLCGLWHGAAWTFIVWGGLHGLALAAHRLWLRFFQHEALRGRLWQAGAWALTILFVVMTWVFFRADSLHTSVAMLQSMVSPTSFAMTTEIEGLGGESELVGVGFGWTAILFAVLWVLIAPMTQELMRRAMRAAMYRPYIERASLHFRPSWKPSPAWVVASAAIFTAAFLGLSRVSEFIYYNF